tara:strand:- start:464 stop:634 length:171 start_codon:yes stop_codon:yes gene_type:complete
MTYMLIEIPVLTSLDPTLFHKIVVENLSDLIDAVRQDGQIDENEIRLVVQGRMSND